MSSKRTRSIMTGGQWGAPRTSIKAKRPKVASQAYVKRLIRRNEEMKYAIINASYNATTTPGLYCLSNTSQGDTGGSHIGDESTMRNLELRLIASVADATNSVRVILFRWKPNIGYVAPGAGSVLKDASSPGNLTSLYLEDGEDQYQVMYDEVFLLAAAGGNPEQVSRHIRRKFTLKCDFLTSTSNASNMIYLMLLSDSSATTHPSVQFMSKIGFTDA